MRKEIIVNAGRLESRVAIMEEGQLAELYVEREPKVAGNIYKGRITNVVSGMDAAFAEIGLERHGFLCVDDIIMRREEQEVLGVPAPSDLQRISISKLVRPNQEVLLQVVRAPMGSKGSRVTTRLALPGRYLVLMLHTDGAYVGVSRKITDEKERQRLRKIGEPLRPEGHSLIIRTESEGKGIRELRKDLEFLTQLAERITEKARRVSAPALLHQDLTVIYRVVRDSFSRETSRVLIDDAEAYERVRELVEMIAPQLKGRVMRYEDRLPIFAALNVEAEIERLLRRRVRLPSGGSLTVDSTEALVAIDVNTGRYTGGAGLEETILHTNLEAAAETARQLRLRDLGGIIVVDFIDMEKARHRQQVTEAFQAALKRDRARIKIHEISPLGLVEMTRKRTGESLTELLTDPCPYCSGLGAVRSPLTMALHIERELSKTAASARAEAFLVRAHPKVAQVLIGPGGEYAADIQRELGKPVYIRAMEAHIEEYQVEPLSLGEVAARAFLPAVGEVVEASVVDQDPLLGLEALGLVQGYHVRIANPPPNLGQGTVQIRVTAVTPSVGQGDIEGLPAPEEAAGKKRRRRRRRRPEGEEAAPLPGREWELPAAPAEMPAPPLPTPEPQPSGEEPAPTRSRRRRRRRKPEVAAEAAPAEMPAAPPPAPELRPSGEEPAPTRSRRRRRRRKPEVAAEATPAEMPSPPPPAPELRPTGEEPAPTRARRRWRRRRRPAGNGGGGDGAAGLSPG